MAIWKLEQAPVIVQHIFVVAGVGLSSSLTDGHENGVVQLPRHRTGDPALLESSDHFRVAENQHQPAAIAKQLTLIIGTTNSVFEGVDIGPEHSSMPLMRFLQLLGGHLVNLSSLPNLEAKLWFFACPLRC